MVKDPDIKCLQIFFFSLFYFLFGENNSIIYLFIKINIRRYFGTYFGKLRNYVAINGSEVALAAVYDFGSESATHVAVYVTGV